MYYYNTKQMTKIMIIWQGTKLAIHLSESRSHLYQKSYNLRIDLWFGRYLYIDKYTWSNNSFCYRMCHLFEEHWIKDDTNVDWDQCSVVWKVLIFHNIKSFVNEETPCGTSVICNNIPLNKYLKEHSISNNASIIEHGLIRSVCKACWALSSQQNKIFVSIPG